MPSPEEIRLRAMDLLSDPGISEEDKKRVMDRLQELGLPLRSESIDVAAGPMYSEDSPEQEQETEPATSGGQWLPPNAKRAEKMLSRLRSESKEPTKQEKKKQEPSGIESFVEGLTQGASVNLSDEAMGIGALLAGLGEDRPRAAGRGVGAELDEDRTDYTVGRDAKREEIDEAREANPGSFLSGELTGGLAPGFLLSRVMPAPAATPSLASGRGAGEALKTVLRQLPSRAREAAITGGSQGAVLGTAYGLGGSRAEEPLEMAKDAATSGAVDGALGAALGPLMEVLLGVPLRTAGRAAGNVMTSGADELARRKQLAELAGARYSLTSEKGMSPGPAIERLRNRAAGEVSEAVREGRAPEILSASEAAAEEATPGLLAGMERTRARTVRIGKQAVDSVMDSPNVTKEWAVVGPGKDALTKRRATLPYSKRAQAERMAQKAGPGHRVVLTEKRAPLDQVIDRIGEEVDSMIGRDETGSFVIPESPIKTASNILEKVGGATAGQRTMSARELTKMIENFTSASREYSPKEGIARIPQGEARLYKAAADAAIKVRDKFFPEVAKARRAQSRSLGRMKDVLESLGVPRDAIRVEDADLSAPARKVFSSVMSVANEGGKSFRQAANIVLRDDPEALRKLLESMGVKAYEEIIKNARARMFVSPMTGSVGAVSSGDVGSGFVGGLANRFAGMQNVGTLPASLTARANAQADLLSRLVKAYSEGEVEDE